MSTSTLQKEKNALINKKTGNYVLSYFLLIVFTITDFSNDVAMVLIF